MQKLLAFPSVFVLQQQQQAAGGPQQQQQQQQVLTLAAQHSSMQQRSDAVAGVLETLRKEQVGCFVVNNLIIHSIKGSSIKGRTQAQQSMQTEPVLCLSNVQSVCAHLTTLAGHDIMLEQRLYPVTASHFPYHVLHLLLALMLQEYVKG
jgi:hypothetical protein